MDINANVVVMYAQFLIVMAPALIFLARQFREIPRQNLRDRRALAEQKLARLHDLAKTASPTRRAA